MKVLIFGYGVSGQSAWKLLEKQGHEVFGLDDRNNVPQKWQGEEVDLVILSPGIPKTHPKIAELGVPIINEVEYAYRFLNDEKLLGVTGTNGKTTTVSLADQILNHVKVSHFTGGNIGTPFCEYILSGEQKEIVLLELSSFQCELLDKFHADASLLTNLSMSHQERYQSFEEYKAAKMILFGKSDICFGEFFQEVNPKAEYDYSSFPLLGEHNLTNLKGAICLLETVGIDSEKIQQSFPNLKGVEHRLEVVESGKKYRIINDSKSTNIKATETALSSLVNEEVILVLGGQLRSDKIELDPIARFSLTKVLAYGEAADLICKQVQAEKVNFENIPKYVPNDFRGTLLFSPAFPSFDLFKNFEDRGLKFKNLFF